jgi:N utilization substance protein B
MSRASGHQKSSPAARRKARRFALQALYQWQVSGSGLGDIEAEFRTDNDMSKVDDEYFHDILHGVPKEKSVLDEKIQPFLDRRIDELTPVELAILRLGAFEMCHRIDVPYKVVINEAIELRRPSAQPTVINTLTVFSISWHNARVWWKYVAVKADFWRGLQSLT